MVCEECFEERKLVKFRPLGSEGHFNLCRRCVKVMKALEAEGMRKALQSIGKKLKERYPK